MEYLTNASGWQTEMAFEIRNRKIPVKLFGLVHLPGSNLDEIYKSDNYIRKSAEALDKIIVFGSTLEHYFEKLGFGEKTIRTFHYVDTEYYRPSVRPKSGNLQVIHMGSLKRNFSTLKNIVEACPEIEFHICQGKDDLSPDFRGFANARLYGFLLEKELLRLMQSCHVSLSIMEDSVGSNVITTSMACGLVNVVSGVGSVRDYCNEGNSFICNTKDELIDCLKNLCDDKNLIKQKSNQSVIKADCYSLYRSIAFFDDLFNKID
ncbi:MAG: glycosyltransferase [Bacteroidales bacterium]